MQRIVLAFSVFVFAACAPIPRTLTVSAAANLQPAFTEIGAQFERATGTRVIFNFGATIQLGQQIEQGAPVDLFAAADRATIDELAARGLLIPDTVKTYARGQLVLYSRTDNAVQLQSLPDLTKSDIKRVAIANPERAPYGAAARQALQNLGLWETLQPKIVFAENIQQTQQYADTGNVDAAIIAHSLAINSTGRWVLIPNDLHNPIDQALGVVKGAKNERAAREFAAFVMSAAGRTVLAKFGYAFPN